MSKRSLLLSALATVLVSVSASAQDRQSFETIERGRYLAVLGDCAGCHSTPDGSPFGGDLALQTPFGPLLAPNITPDKETGIGAMTDKEFVSALKDGRGRNGKRLYPAMPYTAYSKMTDDDVLAMRAYLNTVAPVHHSVEPNQLRFPFNIRLSLLFWNWLNFKPTLYKRDDSKSDEWNRGAYIVEGPGHCGACHTPKTIMGGDRAAQLSGGVLQGWYAPSLTQDNRTGIGSWSKDDLVNYLKTGANNFTLASGPMAETVRNSTSKMADDDLAAIATYLKDSGIPTNADAQPPADPALLQMKLGAVLYKDNCSACHKDNASGEPHLFPKLAGSALVQSDDPTTLVRIVLQGARAVATDAAPTAPSMPAFDWRLNDEQIAALLTYVRNNWGNAASSVAASSVAHVRKSTAAGP
jgi:mono/diheme cytochrome c family protein